MKEKITEILKAYTKKNNISASSVVLEEYAEELVRQGVIVPPCKVGDIVFTIFEGDIEALKVTYTKTEESSEFVYRYYDAKNKFLNMPFSDRSIGKTVFLTKEEAEQALKERG
jgi:hypothetical protein